MKRDEIESCIRRLLKPGMTAVDGGAGLGRYTIVMAEAVGPTGRVLAIEAEAANAQRVRETCGSYRHVRVVRAAFAGQIGVAPLFHDVEPLCHSLRPINCPHWTGTISLVPTMRLDDVMAMLHWPVPDLVKLDLQGLESEVIRTMRLRPPALITELWPNGDDAWWCDVDWRDDYALHYLTGDPISQEQFDKMLRPLLFKPHGSIDVLWVRGHDKG